MSFDLEKMTTEDLRQLNHAIVDILQSRRQSETYKALSDFCVGDHVMFDDHGDEVRGHIVRVNKKSVSIDAYDPPGRWRVSPKCVSKIEGSSELGIPGNVVDLFRP